METLPNGQAPIDRAAVLDLAGLLTAAVDEIDLDVIDGEFYWRFCRRDLFPAIERLLDRIEEAADESARVRWAEEATQALDALEAAIADDPEARFLKIARDPKVEPLEKDELQRRLLRGFLDEYQGEVPNILSVLIHGAWLRLRDTKLEIHMCSNGTHGGHGPVPLNRPLDHFVTARVFSRALVGANVEGQIRAALPRERVEDGLLGVITASEPTWSEAGTASAVKAAFEFVERGKGGRMPIFGRPAYVAPHVVVSVALPLPPEGVVGVLYDRVVRETHRWHERLPGEANGQQRRTAIRTWAVGLLVGAGVKTNVAIGKVSEVMGVDEEGTGDTQGRFIQTRQELIARVPEAEDFLYAPGKAPGIRAKGSQALS